MASQDSFGARARSTSTARPTRSTGSTPSPATARRREPALQPEGPAGEPAPHRGRRRHHRRPHPGPRRLGRGRRARQGDPVHAGARDHAGLHRRALHRRPGHHARGDGRPRRRRRPRSTRSPRPSWSSTTRSSPTSSAPPRPSSATSRSSTSATASATSSCAGARSAFEDFKVVPPGTGIVHQVNIEHLARVVFTREIDGELTAYPDTCVGTDSHTTMVNGIGVVGWGVGGIEAEAAMLGQPVSMLIPRVVGFKLNGDLPEGATATDLVLTITEMLRKHGVVGKFVEFYGPGVSALPLANRATIGNMSPEFGSTIAVFPIDEQTLDYLELTGRSRRAASRSSRPTPRSRASGTTPTPSRASPSSLELDLSTVVPSARRPEAPAGPRRAHRRQGVVPRRARRLRRRVRRPRTGTTSPSRSPSPPRLAEPRVAATAPRRRPTTWTATRRDRPPVEPGHDHHRRHRVRGRPRRRRDRRDHLAAPTPPTRR